MRGDRLEERHAGIAAVGQQQAIRQGRRVGQKRALRLLVGGELHGAHLVGEPAVGRVDFHPGGFDRGGLLADAEEGLADAYRQRGDLAAAGSRFTLPIRLGILADLEARHGRLAVADRSRCGSAQLRD